MSDYFEYGVPRAEHDAAVNAARTEGETAGIKAGASAERARLAAILSNESVKTSAARMAAAIDLAAKAPGMSADWIVNFVKTNVAPAGSINANSRQPVRIDAAAIYESRRRATPDPVLSSASSRHEDRDPESANVGAGNLRGINSAEIYAGRRRGTPPKSER